MKSLVSQVSRLLDGTHVLSNTPADGLRNYHAARACVNARRLHDSYEKLAVIKQALHAYRVTVTLGLEQTVGVRHIHIRNNYTNTTVVL